MGDTSLRRADEQPIDDSPCDGIGFCPFARLPLAATLLHSMRGIINTPLINRNDIQSPSSSNTLSPCDRAPHRDARTKCGKLDFLFLLRMLPNASCRAHDFHVFLALITCLRFYFCCPFFAAEQYDFPSTSVFSSRTLLLLLRLLLVMWRLWFLAFGVARTFVL